MPQIRSYSVKAFNAAVAETLGRSFSQLVMVMGELGAPSYSKSAYGEMVFFSLHDGDESLSCVSYGKYFNALCSEANPFTGEITGGRAGLDEMFASSRQVVCLGKVVTYAKKGQSKYQLLVMSVTPTDKGSARKLELRRIEERLAARGCFAVERKRPIPKNPSRVALVTAKGGAVIHDFLRTAETRGTGSHIRLFPVRVQGQNAGRDMAAAVAAAGRCGCEVVVLIRGGGSEDDLACFNDERLALAVFECPVPVVAGIGHEVDFTFADRIADLRSSTPTKAAQDLWDSREELSQSLLFLKSRARRRLFEISSRDGELLSRLGSSLRAQNPLKQYERSKAEADAFRGRLDRAASVLVQRQESELLACAERLEHAFFRLVAGCGAELSDAGKSLGYAAKAFGASYAGALKELSLRLAAVSPLDPLNRGFALVRKEDGEYAKSVSDLGKGDVVEIAFKDGSVLAVVVGAGVFKRSVPKS